VHIDRIEPDNYWFGARPQILLDRRGAGADEMIAQLRAAVANYPYPNTCCRWPGPDNNTFLAHIARQVPELRIHLPSNTVGKDLAFRCRFMGSAASCSPLARLSRQTCWASVLESTR